MICLFLALGPESIASPPTRHPQLRRIEVQRPNIVIRGAYLDKVEVWAVPTGTGITPDEYVPLGNAKRKNAAGSKEIWLFPIPRVPRTRAYWLPKSLLGVSTRREL
jgi:hypothetical protein